MKKRTLFGLLAAMSDAVVGAGAVSPDFARAAYASETVSRPNVSGPNVSGPNVSKSNVNKSNVNKTVKRAVVNFVGEPLRGRV
jgi:hypothetical protein